MAQQELNQLRQKFQTQEREFQNYRDQCKTLQTFLEEESTKKQKEIRKLKEEAINKEKSYKLMKIQNSQLVAELTAVRAEMARSSQSLAESNFQQKIKDVSAELALKNESLKELKQRSGEKEKQLQQLVSQNEQLRTTLEEKEEVIKGYEERIAKLDETVQFQKKLNDQLFTKNNELFKNQSNNKTKDQATVRKGQKQQHAYEVQLQQNKVQTAEKLKRYEDKIAKLEKLIKQLKQTKPEHNNSPSSIKEEGYNQNSFKMYIGCLIMTKQHYLSPFLDVNQQTKTIKLFKPARNGCFEKSLGSTKHKFSMLTYKKAEIIQDVVAKIKNYEIDIPHLVLIFGTKKSAKKSIFTEILSELFDFLVQKLKQSDSADCSATYIKKSYDQACDRQQAFNTQQILQLLQKLMNTSGSELKRSGKLGSSKKTDKPRISYFSLRVDQFCLQIATSSFSNISLKQKDDASTFYNNVLYSKLPDVLQTSFGEKYLIFTLNPIVDLYDQCKNILNVSVCKSLFISPAKNTEKEFDTPSKQMLNIVIRKKLQSYEREIEQSYMKQKKAEEECGFYRAKFSELEDRLKKLIITHHGQNYYLKKSPILLAYEKMLKFIHSVQSKNQQNHQSTSNIIQLDEIDFLVNDDTQDCL